jgi:hypothetical protein
MKEVIFRLFPEDWVSRITHFWWWLKSVPTTWTRMISHVREQNHRPSTVREDKIWNWSHLLLENAKLIASITRCKHAMDTRMFEKFLGFFIMSLHDTILDLNSHNIFKMDVYIICVCRHNPCLSKVWFWNLIIVF